LKNVYITGIGTGHKDLMHPMALSSIERADCIIGAKRMIDDFSYLGKTSFISINTEEIYTYISNCTHEKYCVLVSGDTGFYSISKKLTEMLSQSAQYRIENIPAVSSLQYFCSKLNTSWDDKKIISAHGRSTNIISAIIFNRDTFLLTGGEFTPDGICRDMCRKNLGHLKVWVGENLSYENERIVQYTAEIIASMKFDSLSVMLIHNPDPIDKDIGLRSIKDDEFITGNTPMTKSEVRTVSVGKMNLKGGSTVYDIGAGTGSVSIEAAMKLTEGTVYAIEKDKYACKLIKRNIEKFKAYNIELIEENAPHGLDELPAPDSVFIGGSGGNLDEILKAVLAKNPYVNAVINSIALESLNEALRCMDKYKFENVEITNISVSKAKKAGPYHMMMGQNPIYVISGKGCGH